MPLSNPEKKPNKSEKEPSSGKQYMRYAGLATTMFLTLFVAFWLGSKIDQYLGNKTEYIGLLFVMAALGTIFYKLLKELK